MKLFLYHSSLAKMISQFLFTILLLSYHISAIHAETSASDIHALRSIKSSIDPTTVASSTYLLTWNFELDPCDEPGAYFQGILCSVPQDDGDNSSARIVVVDLEGDGLEGFISPMIGNLTELTQLNLRNNKFRGPIPDSISHLTKLTRLCLSQNFLSGSVPTGLRALLRLEDVDLSENRLTGSIIPGISDLRRLKHLNLMKNEFFGRIPVTLTGLWRLETLNLSRNQLSGKLPGFPNGLRSLSLSHNFLSGHISPVENLKHAQRVDLNNNRLSGIIFQGILTLPELTSIDLSTNRFTAIEVAKIPDEESSQLRAIDVQNNMITGHLPRNLVTYRNLRRLDLGHNMFSGEIPEEYGELIREDRWERLALDNNLLMGNIPAGLLGRNAGSVILSQNCLDCGNNNGSSSVCHGGQRSSSECLGH